MEGRNSRQGLRWALSGELSNDMLAKNKRWAWDFRSRTFCEGTKIKMAMVQMEAQRSCVEWTRVTV